MITKLIFSYLALALCTVSLEAVYFTRESDSPLHANSPWVDVELPTDSQIVYAGLTNKVNPDKCLNVTEALKMWGPGTYVLLDPASTGSKIGNSDNSAEWTLNVVYKLPDAKSNGVVNFNFIPFTSSFSAFDVTTKANDDRYFTQKNTPLLSSQSVLDNDIGDGLEVISLIPILTGKGGSVSLDSSGFFQYFPSINFVGTDKFRYTAKDSMGVEVSADVYIVVYP